jgi:hypothetical protein
MTKPPSRYATAAGRTMFDFVRKHPFPLIVVLGRGYSDPINGTVVAHLNTFRAIVGILQPFGNVKRL